MKYKIFFFILFITKISFANNIIFIGDSLTEGYGVDQYKSYVSLVDTKLKNMGINVNIINASISGSTSASAIGRIKWIIKSKPDIVVLSLGANDGLRGQPINNLKKNLTQAIELLLDNNIKVLLTGMRIPTNYGVSYTERFYQVYKDLYKLYDISFMPFLLENVAGIKKFNLPDGIHPNAEGHKIIADNIMPFILTLLKNNN